MKFNLNNNMNIDEFGLYVTMVNEPIADYSTAEFLSTLSTDSEEDVQRMLDGLLSKGYLIKVDDLYAVDKCVMLDMIRR